MQLMESGEMYLETILVLSQTKKTVRAIDVSEYMGFSKPSVSRAVNNLKSAGYIKIAEDGGIILTADGKKTAEKIYERHKVLTQILIELGVPEQLASEDACKIEHDISDETFAAVKKHLKATGS